MPDDKESPEPSRKKKLPPTNLPLHRRHEDAD